MFNGICADDFKHVKESEMVLVRCPNCDEWFDLKYGVSWSKLTPNVPHNLYFCTTKCMGRFTEKYTARKIEPGLPSWQKEGD